MTDPLGGRCVRVRADGGEHAELCAALLMQRAHAEEKSATREVISEMVRAHVFVGSGFCPHGGSCRGIRDLLGIAIL